MSRRRTGAREEKTEAALRRLDIFFDSPANQRKGFATRESAQASAATLLAPQMGIAYSTALKIVDKWYRERGL